MSQKNWGATLTINSSANDVWIEGVTLENSPTISIILKKNLKPEWNLTRQQATAVLTENKWIKAMIAKGMSNNEINSWLQSRTYMGNEYNLDPRRMGEKIHQESVPAHCIPLLTEL